MKKLATAHGILLPLLFALTGCGAIGDKSTSMYYIYGITAFLALLLLVGYCALISKKDIWNLFLFLSVFIVNIGYFTLSISKTLEEALLANRLSYLGAVFLPLSMFMIILRACHYKYPKWLVGILIPISLLVFLIAASPGYLDIYYKEVSLEIVNGVSVLNKIYGPWHSIYLFYLLAYFAIMIFALAYALKFKKISSTNYAFVLIMAVSVNIGVWLFEQMVAIDFEFLSISYIISEIFLLSLSLMIQDNEKRLAQMKCELEQNISKQNTPIETVMNTAIKEEKPVAANNTTKTSAPAVTYDSDTLQEFSQNLANLTQTENLVYDLYLAGKSTKEVLAELNIKENTLKYHNKNIYSKLGVSSRKQLIELGKLSRQEIASDTPKETE